MVSISKDLVNFLTIADEDAGQRLDNFLIKILKGVPKSHIQRIIRAGEVRVNKKRAQPRHAYKTATSCASPLSVWPNAANRLYRPLLPKNSTLCMKTSGCW